MFGVCECECVCGGVLICSQKMFSTHLDFCNPVLAFLYFLVHWEPQSLETDLDSLEPRALGKGILYLERVWT